MASGLTQLQQFIVAHYSLDELRTLCFDLEVNYDDLGGEALSGKARDATSPSTSRDTVWNRRRRVIRSQCLNTMRRNQPGKAAGSCRSPSVR
jgi:hypothetical protein